MSISEAGVRLIMAEGQLENAIREARRWRVRKAEAAAKERDALAAIAKWQNEISKTLNGVKSNVSYSF